MKIVEIAPWEESVPPSNYGGTELVISAITESLVARGHEVYLIGSADSKTKATLIPIVDKPFRKLFPQEQHSLQKIEELRSYWRFEKAIEAFRIARDLKPDIIHNHISWRGVLLSSFVDAPIITTVHGPLTAYREVETFLNNPRGNYVSISNNQQKQLSSAHWIRTIYNGIDVESFPFTENRGAYFVFLGRISPEKGVAELCSLIRSTNYKLKIAAKIDAHDVEYFEKQIKPHIDEKQIEFIGEVDQTGKKELLKHAQALLLWLNWEEPFGLVIPEAMACGTPVIVNRRGSMPELVRDGVTGFIVDSLQQMKNKLDDISLIKRSACRAHVEERFSNKTMVEQYEKLMEELVRKYFKGVL